MRYQVIMPKRIFKRLNRVPLPWRERIIKVINLLQDNPSLGIAMTGKYKGSLTVKIWPYRVVHEISNKTKEVIILEISHRGNVSYD